MEKTVSEFYQTEAINYASYDNLRKLAGFIDGLKMSQRKLLYTMRSKFSKEYVKTENFANICTAFTNYLHGSQNLVGVASGMAQSFVGSNNYPLFKGNSGGFGTRINPTYAAGRYTRMTLDEISNILFDKKDDSVLDIQIFEGDQIEPKTFIPIFPVIFLNGSNGMSTGFSETIFPRNPLEIIDYIKRKLNEKDVSNLELKPWFRGFKGEIRENSLKNGYEIVGCIKANNTTSYTISEIPIGFEYSKYIEFLNKLCDDNVIVDYDDNCDTKTDEISFHIKTTREFSRNHKDQESLLKEFKLVKSLPETLCFIDDSNKVKECNSIRTLLDEFISIRYTFYEKRKRHLLQILRGELNRLVAKFVFCKSVMSGFLVISNRKKSEIFADMEKIDKLIKVDDSFDWLLKMPMHSIRLDTMEELKIQILAKKQEYQDIHGKSEKDMWIEDLNHLEKFLKSVNKEK